MRTAAIFLLAPLVACDTPHETYGPVAGEGDYSAFQVSTYQSDQVQPGTTIVALATGPDGLPPGTIYEVDFNGTVLWKYRLTEEQNPSNTHVLDVETNGSSFLFTVPGSGIFEVDREGNELWAYQDPYVSHDSDLLDNGNIIFVRGFAPWAEDQVREIDREGQIVWAWNGLGHYTGSKYDEFTDEADAWAHPTGVLRLASGNTLITMRNFNSIVKVDPEGQVLNELVLRAKGNERNVATRGSVFGARPHDVDVIADGSSYLIPTRTPTRVVKIDRATRELVWEWAPDEAVRADSCLRDANQLSNGNVLVATGRSIVEVNRDGETVWELLSPEITYPDDVEDLSRKAFYKVSRIEISGQVIGN